MSSLGKIILKNIEKFYPNQKINITPDMIDNILEKIQIKKSNITKNELEKVIGIIRNHIDTSRIKENVNLGNTINNNNNPNNFNSNPLNTKEIKTKEKIFRDMNADNDRLDSLNLSYIDNFNKLKEKDLNFTSKKTDIITMDKRMDNIMEEKDLELSQLIVIDSKDRNKKQHPSANQYQIIFEDSGEGGKGIVEQTLRNVIEIELVEIYLRKNIMNFLEFPFLLVEIKEMGGLLTGTDKNINNSVYRINLGDSRDPNLCLKLEGECIKRFEIRKDIPQISIGIKTYDGKYYEFEEEKENQILNSFTFRITTQHKNLVSNFIKT